MILASLVAMIVFSSLVAARLSELNRLGIDPAQIDRFSLMGDIELIKQCTAAAVFVTLECLKRARGK